MEIRTSYPFHVERPSHCPILLNEQRETHADDFIIADSPLTLTCLMQVVV
ncbi:MAG: hypothetical protein ACOYJE_02270 [Bacteroidaceae bacterium]